jgi:hypothetical protein
VLRIIFATFVAISAARTAGAAQLPPNSDTIWYQRIETGCKADAKKYYSAIQFKKRRIFVKNCVARAYR